MSQIRYDMVMRHERDRKAHWHPDLIPSSDESLSTSPSSDHSCSRLAYYCALLNTFLAQALIDNIEGSSTWVLQSPVKNVSHQVPAIAFFHVDRRLEAELENAVISNGSVSSDRRNKVGYAPLQGDLTLFPSTI